MEGRKNYDSVAMALSAAKAAIPRVYEIVGLPEEFDFIVFGCQGHGDEAQKKTAALMADKGVKLAFGAGDNFYDYGIDSPISNVVHERFHAVMPPDIKCIMAGGNHDRRMLNAAKSLYSQYIRWQTQGDDPFYNQIAITYHSSDEEEHHRVVALYQQEKIHVDDLMSWTMTAANSSWIIHNTQIFVLDSSTYLGAYLDYLNRENEFLDGRQSDWSNPAAWFQKNYQEAMAKGRQVLLLWHHPIINIGKRDFPDEYDTEHYINAAGIRHLCRHLAKRNPAFTATDSLGALLLAVLQDQNIMPFYLFNAHEHLLSNTHLVVNAENPQLLRQFTSGGGSGDLHPRVSLRNHPAVGFNEQDSGFVVVTCNARNTSSIKLTVHTLGGLKLCFDESSQFAIVENHPDQSVMMLRNAVLAACNQFFEDGRAKEMRLREQHPHVFSTEEPLLGWMHDAGKYLVSGARGKAHHITRNKPAEALLRSIQHIHTYFNQHQMPDLATCLQKLHELTEPLLKNGSVNESVESFFIWLANQVKVQMDAALEDLFATHRVGSSMPNTARPGM